MGNPTALTFSWDLFLVAGNPIAYPAPDARAGSSNITTGNTFNSPDGLAFDRAGRLWIQTDGSNANTGDYLGQGNNQIRLAAWLENRQSWSMARLTMRSEPILMPIIEISQLVM